MYEIKNAKDKNRLALETKQYNPDFNAKFKKIAGNAKWNEPYWFFDEIGREGVEALAKKYFSDDHVKHKVTWVLSNAYDGPKIDGVDVIDFGRDHHKPTGRLPFPFTVLDYRVKSGGSRANPTVSGEITIIVKARPDALFSPDPASVEVLEDPEPQQAEPKTEKEAETQKEQLARLLATLPDGDEGSDEFVVKYALRLALRWE